MMKNTSSQELYFGDLHFHTHYSDNRDRASIEDMILAGQHYKLSIFGTADHNHNLDEGKWHQMQAKTEILRKKYPNLLLLNNCEVTFLLGHLNVLMPDIIEGTIEEGYRYLYLDPNALKIINHPVRVNDAWHKRIIPDVLGIEVINGEVFTKGKERGYRFASAIEIPSVNVYAAYLSLGIPVAAIGCSDAHSKSALGKGVTGFWLPGEPDNRSVVDAIKGGRTFAATDSAIVLDWQINEAEREIFWNVEWKDHTAHHRDLTVEIYYAEQKIHTAHGSGKITVEKAGFYWIALFNEHDLAVSSPIRINGNRSEEQYHPDKVSLLNKAIHYIRKDITWLSMNQKQIPSQTPFPASQQDVALQILSGDDSPHIIDAHGKDVLYEVLSTNTPRVIIDKECDAYRFEEFYLWLERNELHEYVFANMTYSKIEDSFSFRGQLVPKKMVHRQGIETRYQQEIAPIKTLIDSQTTCRIHVSTFSSLMIRFPVNQISFPLRIIDDSSGLASMLLYIEEDAECPVHILNPIGMFRYDESQPLQEKIYQVFV